MFKEKVENTELNENLIKNDHNKTRKQLKKQQKAQKIKNKYFNSIHYLNPQNCFLRLFFGWISKLLTYGNFFQLDQKSIPLLTNNLKSQNQFNRFQNQIQNINKSNIQGLTIIKMISKVYFKKFLQCFILVIIIVFLGLYGPILTNQIILYIQSGGINYNLNQGLILFFTVFITLFIKMICQSHMYYYFGVLGYNLSNTLSLLIYQKALKHPLLSQKKYTVAQIINYSQVDAQRMTYLGFQLVVLFIAPLQIIFGVYLTYNYIGIAFLSGIAVIIILFIITGILTKLSTKANDKLLIAKDSRVKTTQQILNIIRFIKINSFEKYFFSKLNIKRNQQLELNKRMNLLNVITIFIYWLSIPLILSLTFITYTWLGNQITAGKAFTTIMLFRLLQFSIRMFPTAMSQVIQIWSSLKRIELFLFSHEITKQNICYINDTNFTIKIINGNYYWGIDKKKNQKNQKKQNINQQIKNNNKIKLKQQQQQIIDKININQQSILSQQSFNQNILKQQDGQQYRAILYDINITFKQNQITMIFGDIGSGKSSLLYAILNEMKCSQQSMIQINGDLAFASQKPWIMSTTVKQNIIFNQPFNQQKFNDVLYYSCLEKDLELLVKGQETQIGEKGINLSGGQKARISFARALYSGNNILLLDDIISAVDVHVGQFIMKQTILKYLKGKTIIMPTHAIQFAQYSDKIIIMKRGRIIVQGIFEQIKQTNEFKQIYQVQKQKIKQKLQNQQKDNIQAIEDLKLIKSKQKSKDNQNININNNNNQLDRIIQQLIMPQQQQKGQIKLQIYLSYIKLNGGWKFSTIIIFCMISWIILSTLANIEIQNWCNNPATSNYYLYLFLGLSISSSFFVLIRAYTLVLSGVKQGATIHKRMIKSLLYADLNKFYNRVPLGRIVNRLTKDLRQLDESIGYNFGNFLVSLFSLGGNIIICVYASTVFLIIPVLFVLLCCYKIKQYYMKSQRQCVRLQNITTSPIISGFMSVISGVSIIRAYKYQNQFLLSQINKIDLNKRMRITRQALQSWFAIRLTFFSLIINMTAIGFCIISQSNNSQAASVGLLLTYALTLNDDIIEMIFSFAYLQTKMISVQRVVNFTKIDSELGYKDYMIQWHTKQQGYNKIISKGQIEFKNVSVSYRQDLPKTLKNITLKIKSGQKIGIVGRTGAGKSTIINTLLRILQPCEGQLLIDDIDITKYSLKDLRYALTMIDQQPTIIHASFRNNLDPRNVFTNQQIMKIVNQCNLNQTIQEKGGLDAIINNDSLSVGQRQLLCICRAFLKESLIVLIDQATANIDLSNDSLIQNVIQQKFKYSTVITIAHRLSTLKNSDKILVLEQGKVLEWGTPQQLQQIQKGVYKQMCKQPNSKDYLS